MSPKGTKWDDLEREKGAEVSLRDRAYEEKERRERKEDDERELAAYAEVRRRLRRKARRRKRRDDIRLAVAEWGLVEGSVGLRGGNIDRDGDAEEGGGLGWLDIALRRSKNQRQISPERSALGDAEDLSDDEESVSVSCSFPYLCRSKSNSGANAKNHSPKLCRIRVTPRPLQHPIVGLERNRPTNQHHFGLGKGMRLVVSNVLLRRGI